MLSLKSGKQDVLLWVRADLIFWVTYINILFIYITHDYNIPCDITAWFLFFFILVHHQLFLDSLQVHFFLSRLKLELHVWKCFILASYLYKWRAQKALVLESPPSLFRNSMFFPPPSIHICHRSSSRVVRPTIPPNRRYFPTAGRVSEEARRFLWPYLGQHWLSVRPEEHFQGPKKKSFSLSSMTRKISKRRHRRSWLHHVRKKEEEKKKTHGALLHSPELFDSQEVWHTQQLQKKFSRWKTVTGNIISFFP